MKPIIEFHIIQSFPVSCLNRDDVGSPKTVTIGGVPRIRVSSQCWKRAVRTKLHDLGITLGIRTKKVSEVLAEKLLEKTKTEQEALASEVAKTLTDDTLLYLSSSEYDKIVDCLVENKLNAKSSESSIKSALKKLGATVYNGLDIALFGRMVAKASEMNVEAACSFSHAFTTHKAIPELDFFSGLDDLREENGGGHLGVSEYSSGTFYRYISLDVGQLIETLGLEKKEDIDYAISNFVKALYLAVPSARQKTMAASSTWDFCRCYVRNGQPLQCVFDAPVKMEKGGGYAASSIKAMLDELNSKECRYGSLFNKKACIDFGEETACKTIDDLIEKILEAVHHD